MMRLALFYPVSPMVITQEFGKNLVPNYKAMGLRGHPGVDCAGIEGQEIFAASDGKVVFAGADEGGGCGVVIRTEDEREINGESAYIKHIYWHILPNIPVGVGQIVKVGDTVGYMGSTGAKGVHLHFSIKPQQAVIEQDWQWYNTQQANGYAGNCDPKPYFNEKYASGVRIQYQIIEKLKLLVGLLTSMLKSK